MHRKRHDGFTLYELIVTIAVAAMILSFGVPGFMNFIQNSRATTHTNDVVTALNLARSEATRRGGSITVCSSANGSTCSGSNDWSTGWVVRAGADVLRVWPERSGGAGIVTGNVSQVIFQSRGSISGVAPEIDIALPDCSGDNGREVKVNAAGRIAVSRVAC